MGNTLRVKFISMALRDSGVYPKQTCLVTKGSEKRTGINI